VNRPRWLAPESCAAYAERIALRTLGVAPGISV
jgi:hypothetical protein